LVVERWPAPNLDKVSIAQPGAAAPAIILTLENYVDLLKQMKRPVEANRLEARARKLRKAQGLPPLEQ